MPRFPDGEQPAVTTPSVPTTTAAIGDTSPPPVDGQGSVAWSITSSCMVAYVGGVWICASAEGLPQRAIAVGATTPVPGTNDPTVVYSTIDNTMIRWNGSAWVRVSAVSATGLATGVLTGGSGSFIDVPVTLSRTMPTNTYTATPNVGGVSIGQVTSAVQSKTTTQVVVRITNTGVLLTLALFIVYVEATS